MAICHWFVGVQQWGQKTAETHLDISLSMAKEIGYTALELRWYKVIGFIYCRIDERKSIFYQQKSCEMAKIHKDLYF